MNSKNILPSAAVVFMLISSGCVPNVSQPVQAKPAAQSAKPAQVSAPARSSAQPRQAKPIVKRTGDWRDWPISVGDWVYRQDSRGSIALFGKPSGDAAFMIRCSKSNRAIYLSRAGSTSRSGTQMTVRASSGLKSFAAHNSGGQLSYIASQLAPTDTFLDKVAFSRGRFVVEIAGHAELVIPIWPEFTRVVEDCRS